MSDRETIEMGDRSQETGSESEERDYLAPAHRPPHPQLPLSPIDTPAGEATSAAQPDGDEESNAHFFSEPSISEDGGSESRVQAPHRFPGSGGRYFRRMSSDDDDERQLQPRRAQQSPAPSSPENTSLSSWDSPARNKVLFQFASSGRDANTPPIGKQVVVETMPNGQRVVAVKPPQRGESINRSGTESDDDKLNSFGSLPALDESDGKRSLSKQFLLQANKPSTSSNNGRNASSSDQSRPNSDIERSLNEVKESLSYAASSRNDSMKMELSDSEDDIGEVAADDTNRSDDALDWEAQHSADDEHTNKTPEKRPQRLHKPKHKRTRSGDAAAATIATGGKDWKGMELNKIPLPDEDDDEDDSEGGSTNTDGLVKAERGVAASTKPPKPDLKPPSGRIPALRQEETTNLMPGEPDTSLRVGYGSLSQYGQTQNSSQIRPETSVGDPRDQALSWRANARPPFGNPFPPNLSPQNTWASQLSSNESFGLRGLQAEDDYDNYEDNESFSDDDRPMFVRENQLLPGMQFDSLKDIEERFEDKKFRGSFQNVLRPQRVQLPDSPFANIGKASAEKAPRAAFLPQSLHDEDGTPLPTYICPRCKTRQREFFTVADAPPQLEGPSAYLALYFGVYLISSLFIFGLEEGWKPLDCVYFAVVTLTTAGLGDFTPTTDVNRIICSIFIYFGVACIGLLLGTYIAGMLDERAFRDAKKKQVESCPNCARIQTLKENAVRAQKMPLAHTPQAQPQAQSHPNLRNAATRHMSVRQIGEKDSNVAVYVPRHHHHHHHGSNHNLSGHERNDSEGIISTGSNARSGSDRSQQSASFGLSTPPDMSKGFGGFNAHRGNRPPPPPLVTQANAPTMSPTPNVLGSPVTRQILNRQGHTRHSSIDASGVDPFKIGVRKFSADIPTPPTIKEGIPLEAPNSAPPAPLVGLGQNDSYGLGRSGDFLDDNSNSDDDDESVSSSSSSVSTVDEIMDENIIKIKLAKYVFLTIRQALVNSMIIIAVGCIGFWLIEGFPLISSWYFTTVYLTTVGYGDIVPVTDGGKLFATVYILVAGTVLINNMSMISMIPLELRKRRIERAVLTQFGDRLDDAALRELATGPLIQRLSLSANRADGLDECTREMFALAMLVRLGKVSEQDIKETFAVFRRLDVNNEGVLNSKSIIAGMIQRRRSRLNLAAANQNVPPPPPFFGGGVAETTKEMEGLWVGPHGSLHVETAGKSFRFQAPGERGRGDDPNERSSLLRHQESSMTSSDSQRSQRHSRESPF